MSLFHERLSFITKVKAFGKRAKFIILVYIANSSTCPQLSFVLYVVLFFSLFLIVRVFHFCAFKTFWQRGCALQTIWFVVVVVGVFFFVVVVFLFFICLLFVVVVFSTSSIFSCCDI